MKIQASLALLSVSVACACGGEGPPRITAPPLPTATVSVDPRTVYGDAAAHEPLVAARIQYPATRREDVHDAHFGVEVADPYRWLEDASTDEVKEWMKTEDAFARERLAALPGRDALLARLKELSYIEGMGIPIHRGSRYFFSHRDATSEKWTVLFRESLGGKDEILLDPNTWSPDGSLSLGGWWVSHDGKRVAYKVKKNNSDEATLYVMDVATRKKSDVDVIAGAKYAGASWTPSGDGFYYVFLPTDAAVPVADRPGQAEVRFHKLGTDPKKDTLVRERTNDPSTFVNGWVSRDGRWLFSEISYGWNKNDVYFQDLTKRAPRAWQPLVVGKDARFDVTAHKGRFYVQANDGAPKYRMFVVDPARPARDAWTEIVPERKDATLRDFSIVGDKMSLTYMKDVVTELEVRELDGKPVRTVTLPGLGSASALVGNEDEDEAYYSFTSFTHPTEIYSTSVKKGTASLWYRLKAPVDPSRFVTEQLFARSADGTRVPMFVIHDVDAKRDGSAPTILYGYGGFQNAQTPGFNAPMYAWLERGGTYAIANLRGGSEYGEDWHRAGMGKKKQNVFDDFIAVAEHLVHERYARPETLVIRGASNGGLLVGAALTQRPDLFGVALCGVPLLDMVRYHKFGSGKTWIAEYGSADASEDEFKAIYAYSPYHHVKRGTRYPSVLILSADSDDRVDPLHARKFAAELQDASTGGPVLLRIEKNSGHGGADLVKAGVEKLADEYAFALSEVARNASAHR